jgi:uncharacterized membrane protein
MDRSRLYFSILILTALWCAAIVAAPVLQLTGSQSSTLFYSLFSRVCHQFPDRSFLVSGEPFAVCMRCSSVYFGFLLALMLYPFLSSRRPGVPPPWLLLLALCPMAVDVALNVVGIHESTSWTRTVSGGLAGLILPFYLVPVLQDAVQHIVTQSGGLFNAGKTR